MSQPTPPRPSLDVRGAVDLSALGRQATPPPGGGEQPAAAAAGGAVVDVTGEADFTQAVQQSLQVPVVFSLWASWSEASQTVTAELVRLAGELDGRVLVARVDAEAVPQVAQAFQAQTVPTVVAVLKGQALPLFQGPASPEDIRAVLDQLLEAAAANGVTGRLDMSAQPEVTPEPEEPPLPPLHQAAYDAIERDDLAGAVAAYEQALAEDPKDDLARAGLGQVQLLRRTQDVDLGAARAAAAAAPTDVDAQLVVADLDVLGGQVEDAFARLVDLVRATSGDDRERVRVRLVELFGVVGDSDPRVTAARRALANALY